MAKIFHEHSDSLVTYITAWVDKMGTLHFWDDVYARDPIQKEK